MVLPAVIVSYVCGDDDMVLADSMPGKSKSIIQHRNYGVVLDKSTEGSSGCSCPTLTWTILEILLLTALIAVLVATAGRIVWILTGQLMVKTGIRREIKRGNVVPAAGGRRTTEGQTSSIRPCKDGQKLDHESGQYASQETFTRATHGPGLGINY